MRRQGESHVRSLSRIFRRCDRRGVSNSGVCATIWASDERLGRHPRVFRADPDYPPSRPARQVRTWTRYRAAGRATARPLRPRPCLLQHDHSIRVACRKSRDLEQQSQQLGHGNFVGAARMDRFANGADRLGKVGHPIMRRDISRLEMHFSHPLIVAGDEAEEDLRRENGAPSCRAAP